MRPVLTAAVAALAALAVSAADAGEKKKESKPSVDKVEALPNPVRKGERFKLSFTVLDPAGGEVGWKAACDQSQVRESPGTVPSLTSGSKGTSTGGPVPSGTVVTVEYAAFGTELEGGIGRDVVEDRCEVKAEGGKGKMVTIQIEKPRAPGR